MRARIALGGLIVALVVVPLLASARHGGLADPRDTDGLLDVKEVRLHGDDARTWKVITFARWGIERVFDRGYALVNIDARGDGHFEHYVLVRSVGTRMKAELFRNRRHKPDFSVGNVKVWRTDRRSVSVQIPLRKLSIPTERTFYRWYVQTLMTGNQCPRVCIDRAPDQGSVEELLVEPTPTPTVTVDPSPSITAEPSPSATVDPPSTSPTPSSSPG